VRLVICPDYQDVSRRFISGELAFAVFPAYAYIRTARVVDLKLLANLQLNDADCYRGAVVVRRDSSLKSIDDLRGNLAFVSPDSAWATSTARALRPPESTRASSPRSPSPEPRRRDAEIVARGSTRGAFGTNCATSSEGGDISNLKIGRTDPVPFDTPRRQASRRHRGAGDERSSATVAEGRRPRHSQWRAPTTCSTIARHRNTSTRSAGGSAQLGIYPKVSPEDDRRARLLAHREEDRIRSSSSSRRPSSA
jgi:hypothetical protein